MRKMICLLGSLLFLTGCASVTKGTGQSIDVNTAPVTEARCRLQNDKGTWYVDSTPGAVKVHRSYKDLHLSCDKKGYQTAEKTVKSKTTINVAGNVLVGGVIGAGVDVINGSAYDYPATISVPMKK